MDNPALIQAWMFISVGLNVFTTALIVFRLISVDREIGRVLSTMRVNRTGTTTRAVFILIESAAPPSVFGLLWVIVDILRWKVEQKTTEWMVTMQVLDKILSLFYYGFLVSSYNSELQEKLAYANYLCCDVARLIKRS